MGGKMISKNTFFLALIGALLACALPVHSALAQPIVFSKTEIVINRLQPIDEVVENEVTLEDEDGEEYTEIESTTVKRKAPPYPLDVQVREGQIGINQGMYINYHLDAENGLLTFFPEAGHHALEAENISKPVDVLFLTDEGKVEQIVLEVELDALSEIIEAEEPIRAFLYLREGLVEELGIAPGDSVVHGMFTPGPKVRTKAEPVTEENNEE